MDLKEMMAYCSALEKNNEREWFHANHDWYDRAKNSFAELLELLRFTICSAAPSLTDEIMRMSVKDWMYRVARDMRFYKDRPPYDASFRAYICRDKKSWLPLGYYIRLKPGESCFGTGLWCWETPDMNRVRDFLLERYMELDALCSESGLEVGGEMLKRAPRGYDESHPAIEWIKHKNWSVIADIPDSFIADPDTLAEYIGALVSRMEPLRRFLLEAGQSSPSQKKQLADFYGI